MHLRSALCLPMATLVLAAASPNVPAPALFRRPALSARQVAFSFGGDLWVASRSGGQARRLTSDVGVETDPVFSPDGSLLAFTAQYEGDIDVYVIPVEGGAPLRLTHQPGPDQVVGWTPDGKSVLFRSGRASFNRYSKLFTVPKDGGPAVEVHLPRAYAGSYSPDGSQLAYEPLDRAFGTWKRYRGGQASKVWIADLKTAVVEPIPRTDANDFNPMWAGGKVYFLSDRNGACTLFAYDHATKAVTQVLENKGLDIKAAAYADGSILYEQFGSLHLFDCATGAAKALDIRVDPDLPGARPHFVNVAKGIQNADISPSGLRAVFEAHGEILTVPAEKGDIRNLTRTPAAMERDPAWSPDGQSIAYFSDESGEYALHIRTQNGDGTVRKIALGAEGSFFYAPTWSPDSQKLAYTDKRLNLWLVDLGTGKPVKVDTNTFENPGRSFDPSWSPDSAWIAYTRQLPSHLHAVFAFNAASGQKLQLTDGMSDARHAAFDASGDYLYFLASTDAGPTSGWLDMSAFDHSVTRSAYLMVLRKDKGSPLAPESDEEKAESKKAEDKKDDAKKDGPKKDEGIPAVRIDVEGLYQRVLPLPIPPRLYVDLQSRKKGEAFLVEQPLDPAEDEPSLVLHKFDLATRKTEKVTDGFNDFKLADKGEKMLLRKGQAWSIVKVDKPTGGNLNLAAMEVLSDPRGEWRQMFHEVFRLQRDFFYDSATHGLDLKSAEKAYEPYLAGLANRDDLTYLLAEAMGQLTVGHLYITGGEAPAVKQVPGGLLGADFSLEQGRYRFGRIYDGESWNPKNRAPLTQPGVDVKSGEFLLAVDGRDLKSSEELAALLVGKAGKQVRLKVGAAADGQGSREVTVVPVPTERPLRYLAWVEDNRRLVDKLSGGRIAYVHLPNTGGDGFTSFNRYFFAQVGKEGAILDERFNGGGAAADYFIEVLNRPLYNYWFTRQGQPFNTPVGAIFGPKAMLINEYAGSGGDALPWYFHRAKVGTLIGKRTWGGLVGIYDYPNLMDGGGVTAPRVAFFNPESQWEVENHGTGPDIEVDWLPAEVFAQGDPQLLKAVEVVLQQLKEHPLPKPVVPAFPNYHPKSH